MGFLDNSGDIILDAVLTDTGRKRLARGDGSFSVAKFALGDDEINYGLYNKDHVSGSAYYDIEILQTPVLEAFTNNASSMKSKLITISRTNILYLPVIKLNNSSSVGGYAINTASGSYYLIASDESTIKQLRDTRGYTTGILDGFEPQNSANTIVFDQGLDCTALAAEVAIDPDLKESQYVIQMDHRLGYLTDEAGTAHAHSFVDDDQIATYYLTTGDANFVSSFAVNDVSVLNSRKGTRLNFRIRASTEIETSTFLFEQIGLGTNVKYAHASDSYRAIDTHIRIQGGTTGYALELPIRYIKKV